MRESGKGWFVSSLANVLTERRKAVAAVVVSVLLWSSAFVAIRSAAEHYHPGALALGRLLAGAVVLVLVLLVRREGWPPRRAWPGIVVFGVLNFAGYMVALHWGEQQVDAGTAAMIVAVGPIVTALLSGWLLGEGFPPRLLAGLLVSFLGAVVVGSSMSGNGAASILGALLCLVAAISAACGVVAQKPALQYASALQVTTLACLVGALACLPFSGELISDVGSAPWPATANMVYLGVFPTAIAFTTWAYALSRTTAGKAGVTLYAVPAVTVSMSWIMLGELPSFAAFLGGALCLAGVAVSRWKPRTTSRRRPPVLARAD